jgi:hypothetical protein
VMRVFLVVNDMIWDGFMVVDSRVISWISLLLMGELVSIVDISIQNINM